MSSVTWQAWCEYAADHHRPGWSFCSFALRSAPPENRIKFVYGIVRGHFGVHAEEMTLGDPVNQPAFVWSITHLRRGFGCGLFMTMDEATSAAEITDRLAIDWEAFDPENEDRVQLAQTIGRAHLAWVNASLAPAPFLVHHRNPKILPMNIWYRDFTPESRPTKEQMS